MELPIKTGVRDQKFKSKKTIKFKAFKLCPKSPVVFFFIWGLIVSPLSDLPRS